VAMEQALPARRRKRWRPKRRKKQVCAPTFVLLYRDLQSVMWQLAPAYMHAPVIVYVHTHTHSNVVLLCVCIGVDWCLMSVSDVCVYECIFNGCLLYVCVIYAGMLCILHVCIYVYGNIFM